MIRNNGIIEKLFLKKVSLQYFHRRQNDPVNYQQQISNNPAIIPKYPGLQLVKAIQAIVLPLISNLDKGTLEQRHKLDKMK